MARGTLKSALNGRSRYSALSLLRHGVSSASWSRAWHDREMAPSYDVVVVGGGVHGLSTAYHLAAQQGIGRVAVLEKGYIGGGSSGRNTAIVRSNYLTPEGIGFYERSRRLYEQLADELNFNPMFERIGHLTLGHDEGAIRTLRWRAEVNKVLGVDSELVGPREVHDMVPIVDTSGEARYPVLGGLWHPPGGTIRHDAVVWGYARAADAHGVDIHQKTEVRDVRVTGDRVTGVTTDRGDIAAPVVVNCTAGMAGELARMAGLRLPIQTVPLQACVSEPVQPILDTVLASSNLHVYVHQTDRGELVFGGAVDPFPTYSQRGSLEFVEQIAANVVHLAPRLANVRLLRQWSGICDMTPDGAPVIGPSPIEGFVLDVGWGTYGMKAGPAAGEAVAELVATGRTPSLITAFGLERFPRGRLVSEKAAAAVGH